MSIDRNPIILLGMHRSGTSLIAKLLSEMGVFLGNDQNSHNESNIFLEFNNIILNIVHASWDFPRSMENLLNENKSLKTTVKLLIDEINSVRFKKEYWRILKYFLMNTKKLIWGWKDPRTTITFPIWNKIFPDAKYLFIYRNGVDVANSLHQRELKRKGKIKSKVYSLRCLDLNEAFKLWEEYNDFFEKQRHIIHKANLLYISYEDIIEYPFEQLKRLASFLNISIPDADIKNISLLIKKESKYKFLMDDKSCNFYKEIQNTPFMIKYNYNNIQ